MVNLNHPMVIDGLIWSSAILAYLLLFGRILGDHYAVIAGYVRTHLGGAGESVRSVAGQIGGMLGQISARFVSPINRLWSVVTAPLLPPAAPVRRGEDELSPGAILCAAIVIAVAAPGNGVLLWDIIPDILNIPPLARKVGFGRLISLLIPSLVVGGEIFGGLLAEAGRRAGQKKTQAYGYLLFGSCFAFELAAAARRAYEFAADPLARHAGTFKISHEGLATALAYLALAALLPLASFVAANFVEPAVSRLRIPRMFKMIGPFIRRLVPLTATLFLCAGLALSGLTILVAVILLTFISFILLNLLLPSVQTVLAVLILLPKTVMDWAFPRRAASPAARRELPSRSRQLRPPGERTEAGMSSVSGILAALLAALLALFTLGVMAGCSPQPLSSTGEALGNGEVITVQGWPEESTIDSDTLRGLSSIELLPFVLDRVRIVQVEEPSLYVCIADLTSSLRTSDRSEVLEDCARRVALSPPESVGVILPVTDQGRTSVVPVVSRPIENAVRRCTVSPSLPELEPISTLWDRAFERTKDEISRRLELCQVQVARRRDEAQARIRTGRDTFTREVIAAYSGRSWDSTDLLGTLARCRDLRDQVESELGVSHLPVRIDMISDGLDDANGCRDSGPPASKECPDPVLRPLRSLFSNDEVALRFLHFRTDTKNRSLRNRYDEQIARWSTFWDELIPLSVRYTWTPGLKVVHDISTAGSPVPGEGGQDGQ